MQHYENLRRCFLSWITRRYFPQLGAGHPLSARLRSSITHLHGGCCKSISTRQGFNSLKGGGRRRLQWSCSAAAQTSRGVQCKQPGSRAWSRPPADLWSRSCRPPYKAAAVTHGLAECLKAQLIFTFRPGSADRQNTVVKYTHTHTPNTDHEVLESTGAETFMD